MKLAPIAADELPLVFDSWAKSYRKSPWAGTVPNHLWDTVSRACSSEILERGARVTAAVVDLPDGTRRVMGYSVSEPGRSVLHWLFVKRDYRGQGVGRALLTAAITGMAGQLYYSHRTKASSKFLGPGWTWDPTSARVKQ